MVAASALATDWHPRVCHCAWRRTIVLRSDAIAVCTLSNAPQAEEKEQRTAPRYLSSALAACRATRSDRFAPGHVLGLNHPLEGRKVRQLASPFPQRANKTSCMAPLPM